MIHFYGPTLNGKLHIYACRIMDYSLVETIIPVRYLMMREGLLGALIRAWVSVKGYVLLLVLLI